MAESLSLRNKSLRERIDLVFKKTVFDVQQNPDQLWLLF